MKKYLLKFGLLTSTLAPIVAIVSCSKDDEVKVTEVDTTNLVKGNFVAWGNNDGGKVGIKMSKKIPSQVEVRYVVKAEVPTEDTEYKKVVPSTLSNDDKLHIKFFIKDSSKNTHKFSADFTDKFTIAVSGLTTSKNYVDVSLLNADNFYVLKTGSLATGTIGISMVDIPIQVKAQYKKSDGSYEDSLTGLSVGDKITIKVSIKSGATTYMFPGNFDVQEFEFTVSSIKEEIVTTNLSTGSFSTSGTTDGSKVLVVSGLPSQVEARYAKSTSIIKEDEKYKTALPTDLSNTNKVQIRFFVKSANMKTHAFPFVFINTIEYTVS